MSVGGFMIVKQALGGMQNLRPGDSRLSEPVDHVTEVVVVWFVAADVLCGVDRVKSDAQSRIRRGEAFVVDV